MSAADAVRALENPAPIFAALGDSTRLKLVTRLGDGQPKSITQLSEGLNLTRQGVTKHLRVLEGAGLVQSKRVGRESRYRFEPAQIQRAQTYLDEVSRHWDNALLRLKASLEN